MARCPVVTRVVGTCERGLGVLLFEGDLEALRGPYGGDGEEAALIQVLWLRRATVRPAASEQRNGRLLIGQ